MNRLSPNAAGLFLAGSLSWTSGTWKVVALDDGYTYDDTHHVLDDIDGARRVATSPALTGRTATGGVADADDTTLPAPTPDVTIRSLWVYRDTGDETTSTLVAFMDTTAAGTPISLLTTGDDITVPWSNVGNHIFRI